MVGVRAFGEWFAESREEIIYNRSMRLSLRIPLVTGLFLLFTPLAGAQQKEDSHALHARAEIAADLQALHTSTVRLGAHSLQHAPTEIATQVLGGTYQLRLEQAESLTSLRRTLVERTLGGYPISNEIVRVNWLSDGTLLVHGAISKASIWSGTRALGVESATAIAAATFPSHWPLQRHASRLEILPLVSGARLCHRIDFLSSASTSVAYRLWIDAEFGHVWQIQNRTIHSTGQTAVFMPNPVETLNNPNLTDQQDSGSAVPAAAYFNVALEDLDGSGTMTGTWASTAPTPNRSFRANLDFTHNRQGRIFEEALSYYHVTTFQHRLQSLGLTARQSVQPINVVDLLFGFEYANASYNPASGVISFGTRGVDFAEDADVVIHEYGHAIHDDVQGGLSGGLGASDNGSMSEGYGDWIGAVHSDDAITGEWVGVGMGASVGGGFPGVRRVDGMKHYPEDKVGEVHDDGEIWAAALWEIALMVGQDEALQLVIEGMSMMAPSTNMPTAAGMLINADTLLTGGANLPYIAGPLLRSGLLPVPAGQPILEATKRGVVTGDVVNFRVSSPTHAGSNFQVILSRNVGATVTGPPFNTTLDIGTELLGQSLSIPGFQGQLNANGTGTFALSIPTGLPWKSAYFVQAMVLDGSNTAIAQTPPIAFRAERH
jgi:hypothetical protein